MQLSPPLLPPFKEICRTQLPPPLPCRHLDDKCADNPVTWDAKARLALRDDGGDDGEDATSRLRNCIRLYDEGVNR